MRMAIVAAVCWSTLATASNVHDILTGGTYELTMSVHDTNEGLDWPVRIGFAVTDRGEIGRGRIEYPADACRGEIEHISWSEGKLRLFERIVQGRDICEPGVYILIPAKGRTYASVQTNRFSKAEFVLGNEVMPAFFKRWNYMPTAEGRYRLSHGNGGWDDIRLAEDPAVIGRYIDETGRQSDFYRDAVERLGVLLLKHGRWQPVAAYVQKYPDSPIRKKSLRFLEEQADASFDAHLFAALCRIDGVDIRKLYHRWIERAPSVLVLQSYMACRPDEKEAAGMLHRVLKAADISDWEALKILPEDFHDAALREEIVERMLQLARQFPADRRFRDLVAQHYDQNVALDAFEYFIDAPERFARNASFLESEEAFAVYKSFLHRRITAFGGTLMQRLGVLLGETDAPKLIKAFVWHASTFPSFGKDIVSVDDLIRKDTASAAVIALTPKLQVRRDVLRAKQGYRLSLLLDADDWQKSVHIALKAECRISKERTFTDTRTVMAFGLVPVGTKTSRFIERTVRCATDSKARKTFRSWVGQMRDIGTVIEAEKMDAVVARSFETELEVLATQRNFIGKALEDETNAPAACKSIKEQCLAVCEGLRNDNGGLFSRSDRSRCETRCFSAFHHCAQAK